eukprot:3911967-Alexandrium_andersonii.AAC.1
MLARRPSPTPTLPFGTTRESEGLPALGTKANKADRHLNHRRQLTFVVSTGFLWRARNADRF